MSPPVADLVPTAGMSMGRHCSAARHPSSNAPPGRGAVHGRVREIVHEVERLYSPFLLPQEHAPRLTFVDPGQDAGRSVVIAPLPTL